MTGKAAGWPGLLSPEFIALITSGVSTIVASHDASGRPSLMRAVGATTTPDGTRITVYLNRPACPQLLADLQATGQIAVVFSEPFSHLGRIGFGPDYTRTMLAYQLGDVAAVSFSPEQAFDQTPGPKAGACLPPAGGMA